MDKKRYYKNMYALFELFRLSIKSIKSILDQLILGRKVVSIDTIDIDQHDFID